MNPGVSTVYTATINKAVEDESDANLLEAFQWSFTTGAAPDDVVPTVISSTPLDQATGVLRNTKVNVTFSEPMDPASLSSSSFALTKDEGDLAVPGTLRYVNPTTVVLSLSSNLDASTAYTLTMTSALTDLAGNSLALATIGSRPAARGAR